MNLSNISISKIKPNNYKGVYNFQCEYLDKESYGDFIKRVEANPDLYLVAYDENELVGVCYSEPFSKEENYISLQGIVVNLDKEKGYARRGIGSRLIESLEKIVIKKGYNKIGLGSADDKRVESFYLKNGFHPVELVAKGQDGKELERVKVSDYNSGLIKKQELYQKHKPWEVIFIFEKRVGPDPLSYIDKE